MLERYIRDGRGAAGAALAGRRARRGRPRADRIGRARSRRAARRALHDRPAARSRAVPAQAGLHPSPADAGAADAPGGYADAAALSADLDADRAQRARASGRDVVRPLRRLRRAVAMFGFHLCALEWRQHRDKVVRTLDEIVARSRPRLPPLSLRSDDEQRAWFEREFRALRPLLAARHRFSAEATDIMVSLEAVAALRARRGPQTRRVVDPGRNRGGLRHARALAALARACGALDAAAAADRPAARERDLARRTVRRSAEALLASRAFSRARRALRRRLGGHAGLLGHGEGRRDRRQLSWSIYRAQLAIARRSPARHGVAIAVLSRPRRLGRARCGRRARRGRRAAAASARRTLQGHRARRGDQRPLRLAVAGAAQPRTGGDLGARRARFARPPIASRPGMRVLDRLVVDARSAPTCELIESPASSISSPRARRSTRSARCRSARGPARRGAAALDRRSARDPVVVRLGADAGDAAGLVRLRQPRSRPNATSRDRAARDGGRLSVLRDAAAQRRTRARDRRPADLRALRARAGGRRSEPRAIRDRIRAEHGASTAMLLEVLEHDRLLAGDPTLARSIALRNPYVDPFSLMQVRLLGPIAPGARATRRSPTLSASRSTASRPVCV